MLQCRLLPALELSTMRLHCAHHSIVFLFLSPLFAYCGTKGSHSVQRTATWDCNQLKLCLFQSFECICIASHILHYYFILNLQMLNAWNWPTLQKCCLKIKFFLIFFCQVLFSYVYDPHPSRNVCAWKQASRGTNIGLTGCVLWCARGISLPSRIIAWCTLLAMCDRIG